MEVQSQPGQGTTVRVYLPLVERHAVLRDTRVLPEALSKGAETVLLVEEDEIARKLALSTLHGHRYHVLEAGSAVEALLVAPTVPRTDSPHGQSSLDARNRRQGIGQAAGAATSQHEGVVRLRIFRRDNRPSPGE